MCFGASFYQQNGEAFNHKESFEKLGLRERDVKMLWSVFDEVPKDSKDRISFGGFLQYFLLDREPLIERIFEILDESNQQSLDFRDFVIGLWSYCTLAKPSLTMLAFDIYDLESEGKVHVEQMHLMVKEIYGTDGMKDNPECKRILAWIDNNDPLRYGFDLGRFTKFTAKFEGLLRPLFNIQQGLRKNSSKKKKFWDRCAQRRIHLDNGQVGTVKGVLMAHASEMMKTYLDTGELPEELLGQTRGGPYRHSKKKKTNVRKGAKDLDAVLDVTGSLANRRNGRGIVIKEPEPEWDLNDPRERILAKKERKVRKKADQRGKLYVQKFVPRQIRVRPKAAASMTPAMQYAMKYDFNTAQTWQTTDDTWAFHLSGGASFHEEAKSPSSGPNSPGGSGGGGGGGGGGPRGK